MTIRLSKNKPGEVRGHRAWILLEAMRVVQLGVCSAVYGKSHWLIHAEVGLRRQG